MFTLDLHMKQQTKRLYPESSPNSRLLDFELACPAEIRPSAGLEKDDIKPRDDDSRTKINEQTFREEPGLTGSKGSAAEVSSLPFLQ